jgi:N-acylneuraminate cytidylyltransferase
MKKLAIIPARGGSKRIPKKNIKPFLGKPIIAYSIESALQSELFDEVMVSTDDVEIAEIAIKYGANVPFLRSTENSSDFSTTYDVIEEVLKTYKKQGEQFEFVFCIYSTAPFASKITFKKAFKSLIKNNFDCVFPVLPYSFPIQRSISINKSDNKIKLKFPEFLHSRSQDMEKSYHDAGQFYCFNANIIIKNKSLWTDNTGVIIINELEGQDIDNEIDWKLAELKFKLLHEKED